MRLEDYFDFGESDNIRVKGRRIGLEHIIERFKAGATPEEIARYFGDLDLEVIYGSIAYYLHNQAEVDAYLARIAQRTDDLIHAAEADPSSAALRIAALKRAQAAEHLVS